MAKKVKHPDDPLYHQIRIQLLRNKDYVDTCYFISKIRNMTPEEIKKLDLENLTIMQKTVIKTYASGNFKAIKELEDYYLFGENG